MVRRNKPPVRSSVRVRSNVVYAPKASCVVLCPQARMNFAQFCALLMTVDKKLKDKTKDSPHKGPKQERNLKTKGSLISGPLLWVDISPYSLPSLKFDFLIHPFHLLLL